MRRWTSLLAAATLLSACATGRSPAPAPERGPPTARPEPVPPPDPAPAEQSPQDSPDPPLTSGDWSYSEEPRGSAARFGAAGAERFSLRCDLGRRRIVLARQGSSGAMTLVTTYGRRALAAELPSDDPLLDEMAFSRGRFTVEAEGLEPLILPAWPEPARVVDDCRA